MIQKRVNLLCILMMGLFAVSLAACADETNGDPIDGDVDCDVTPDDPACEKTDDKVDCRETPEADECLVRQRVDKYNERRCPELKEAANANLRFEEKFKNHMNARNMSNVFNKSYGEDTLVRPGEAQVIKGRFWSNNDNIPGGGKGPEGEEVAIFRQKDDGTWEILAEAVTDNRGSYEAEVSEADRFERGKHRILSILKADGTCVEHGVFVFEENFETILTDIDATLTTADEEMIEQMLGPKGLEYVPHKLDGAVEYTNAYDNKGFLMLYLSARPVDYLSWTRIWLREEGFPYGPSKGAPNLVFGSTAASYKKGYVEHILNDLSWKILYGYGNAFSDVDGYVDGGIPKDKVYMVNEAGCPEDSVDLECTCYVGSAESKCEKFTDLDTTPYAEQDGVAYRGTIAIKPNKSYSEHIEAWINPHADSNTPHNQ